MFGISEPSTVGPSSLWGHSWRSLGTIAASCKAEHWSTGVQTWQCLYLNMHKCSVTFNSFFPHFSVWFNLILLTDIRINYTMIIYRMDISYTTCNLCIYTCCYICLLYWYFMVRYKSNMAQWIRDPPFLAEALVASQSVQEDIGRQLAWIALFWKKTGWWFQRFFVFTPKIGEDSHCD